MAVITYLDDTFTRANAAVPGSTEVGKQPWVVQSATGTGVWNITSNRLTSTSNGSESYCTADSYHSDGELRATMVNIVDGGIIFRYADTNHFWVLQSTGGVYKLMKRVAGAYTQLGANIAVTPAAGDLISITMDLNSINVYINGNWVRGATDTSMNWATKVGFRAISSAAQYDNFSFVSLSKSGVGPTDPNIVYSPYTWAGDSQGMKTICSGAYFRMAFTGNRGQIGLFFDTRATATPPNIIKYRIDGEAWVRANLAEQISVPMPSGSTWGKHTIEVIVQTAMAPNKWNPQDSATIFRGLAGEDTITTVPINRADLNVLVMGDSITEGFITLKYVSTPDGSDAHMSYAGQLRYFLGAEVGQVGFGSTGWSVAGAGGVPSLPNNYKLMWGGGPARDFTTVPPDLVLINHGTNDGTTNIVATVQATITELLTLLPAKTLVGVIVPFNQNQKANLTTAVANINNPRVKLIDTTGWYTDSDFPDGAHPYGSMSKEVLAPKLAAAARTILNGGGIYMKVAGVARAISTRRN